MKAVRVVRNGRPTEVIEVLDVDVPDPEPGGVRIAVSAASVNFGDIARTRGGVASVMAQPPFTLGMDVCGVVDAAGDGAEAWIGRRVVAMTNQSLGGMAEHALAAGTAVFDAPPGLDDVEAAAFTLPFHVGHLALDRRAMLQTGEHLLVVGGASAVGTAAIQLGVAAGARVIAVAGGPEKIELCASLGARHDDRPHCEHRRLRCGDGRHRRSRCRRRVRRGRRRRHGDDLDHDRLRRPVPTGRASTTIRNRGSPASRCAGSRWATSRSSA